jgi:hypothetical protein
VAALRAEPIGRSEPDSCHSHSTGRPRQEPIRDAMLVEVDDGSGAGEHDDGDERSCSGWM